MFARPPLRSPDSSPVLGRVRRLATVAAVAALAGLGGLLACKDSVGPSAESFFGDPGITMAPLHVEVRDAAGVGVAGVALELRGETAMFDSAYTYKQGATGADGTVNLGSFVAPHAYRLFVALAPEYGFAPDQVSPVYISITGEALNGRPKGDGDYGNPARVIVRVVRLP